MESSRILGLVLVVVGLVLLYFGYQASQSVSEQLYETFAGRFTQTTMLYLIGGLASLIAGSFVLAR